VDDDDELEQTRWDKFRGRRSRYEGDERRGASPPNLLAYLPLLIACLAGVAGYVQMGADVKTLRRDVDESKQQFRDWNVSISQRVRDIERGE